MRLSHVVSAVALAAAVGLAGSGVSWAQSTRADRVFVTPRAALSETVHELNVEAMPLTRVIDYVRDISGTNVVVNWKALEQAGVAKETAITLQVRQLSMRKALQLVLDQASPAAQLTCSIDANVLEITTQEEADKQLVTVVYPVEDLIMTDNRDVKAPMMDLQQSTTSGARSGEGGGGGGGGPLLFPTSPQADTSTDTPQKRADDLVALIKETIRPTIWKDNGGPASIKYTNGKLVVTAPVSVHEAIGGPVKVSTSQRIGM